MAYPELDALEAQCKELVALLDELGAADWERPTRCTAFSVRELVAHVAAVLEGTAEGLRTPDPGPPTTDRVGWWRFADQGAVAARIAQAAVEAASGRTAGELDAWVREGVEAVLEAARSVPPAALVRLGQRVLRADELVATRVLEVGVHTMDLGHATLKGERIHPAALPVVTGILDGLLGARLPPSLGWEPRTYVLTATGRRPLSAVERHTLGPLADRFPLLS